jgi:hypothetical protein
VRIDQFQICWVWVLIGAIFVANGVDVFQASHEPGTFIVTFPQAYHAGFSYGVSHRFSATLVSVMSCIDIWYSLIAEKL